MFSKFIVTTIMTFISIGVSKTNSSFPIRKIANHEQCAGCVEAIQDGEKITKDIEKMKTPYDPLKSLPYLTFVNQTSDAIAKYLEKNTLETTTSIDILIQLWSEVAEYDQTGFKIGEVNYSKLQGKIDQVIKRIEVLKKQVDSTTRKKLEYTEHALRMTKEEGEGAPQDIE